MVRSAFHCFALLHSALHSYAVLCTAMHYMPYDNCSIGTRLNLAE